MARLVVDYELQFLRELHFIEAPPATAWSGPSLRLQFLRELHFIEAPPSTTESQIPRRCSSFGNCTSLRPVVQAAHR